ncbi:MAG TPA: phosphatidylserine decarboxylase family protein [Candidatus Binatia bacterium]|nr:phosphatidylserine decarboxylase family protein [Candidatus Binatia bacterium]
MARMIPIAREGWRVIGVVAGVLGPVAVIGTLAGHPVAVLPLLLMLAFSFYFFRDPERQPPPDDRQVVSPADGKILHVTAGREDIFLNAPATIISIFMSPLDVHVNRSPVRGTIELVKHTAGKFRAAFHDKASLDNERNAMVLESGGRRFVVIQIAGAVARRIINHHNPGDRLERGERYGLIMFGSRVDIFLPPDVKPMVAKGDRVTAGSSVIAEIPAGAPS